MKILSTDLEGISGVDTKMVSEVEHLNLVCAERLTMSEYVRRCL